MKNERIEFEWTCVREFTIKDMTFRKNQTLIYHCPDVFYTYIDSSKDFHINLQTNPNFVLTSDLNKKEKQKAINAQLNLLKIIDNYG